MILVADPATMGAGRTSYLTANVFDDFGNPVANVPVIFTMTEQPAASVSRSRAAGGRGSPTATDKPSMCSPFRSWNER